MLLCFSAIVKHLARETGQITEELEKARTKIAPGAPGSLHPYPFSDGTLNRCFGFLI
jgi:hypothetical protein